MFLHTLLLSSLVPALSLAKLLRTFADVAPIQIFIREIGEKSLGTSAGTHPGSNLHNYDPLLQQFSPPAGEVLYAHTNLALGKARMDRNRSSRHH